MRYINGYQPKEEVSVLKFELSKHGLNELELPMRSVPIHVGFQQKKANGKVTINALYIWIATPASQLKPVVTEKLFFYVAYTGVPFTPGHKHNIVNFAHIGSATSPSGIVVHVFEDYRVNLTEQ